MEPKTCKLVKGAGREEVDTKPEQRRRVRAFLLPQKCFRLFLCSSSKTSSQSEFLEQACTPQLSSRRPEKAFFISSPISAISPGKFVFLLSLLHPLPPLVSLYLVNSTPPCVSRLQLAIADPLLIVLFSIQPKPRSTRFAPSFRPQLLPSSLPSPHHPISSTLSSN